MKVVTSGEQLPAQKIEPDEATERLGDKKWAKSSK
jgi:hypothetical protein